MKYLMDYSYPGNVRELENVVERAVALAEGEVLTTELLPDSVIAAPAIVTSDEMKLKNGKDLDTLLGDFERRLIEEALRRSGGNKTKAASLLGVTFRSFRYRLKKYGMADDETVDDS